MKLSTRSSVPDKLTRTHQHGCKSHGDKSSNNEATESISTYYIMDSSGHDKKSKSQYKQAPDSVKDKMKHCREHVQAESGSGMGDLPLPSAKCFYI
mmetsp:Transcript_80902/g.152929  ORF Transcript_80902/g.152929 Transcript_80902/m.152929 type:complete len:96 (-) Transcript_80902:1173-1460(-)